MYLLSDTMSTKEELLLMIEQIVDQTLNEQNVPKRRLAQNYAKAIKRKNPDLHDLLMKQAIFAIKSIKNEDKPRDSVETINKFLKLDPGADPRKSADTRGVQLFIDAVLDDADMAGKAKRFWQQAIDALIRDTYGQK